ncbi:MAG: ACT domain-containing protein [Clostridia bacterium]|nr:ACT domain-containing protein [Clostridia bacterium]
MKAIITVVGKDQVGIMYRVSGILNEKHVNIEDVTQTILQDYFTMIMVVKIDETAAGFHEVDEALHEMAAEQGLSIHVQKEEIFDTMHKI